MCRHCARRFRETTRRNRQNCTFNALRRSFFGSERHLRSELDANHRLHNLAFSTERFLPQAMVSNGQACVPFHALRRRRCVVASRFVFQRYFVAGVVAVPTVSRDSCVRHSAAIEPRTLPSFVFFRSHPSVRRARGSSRVRLRVRARPSLRPPPRPTDALGGLPGSFSTAFFRTSTTSGGPCIRSSIQRASRRPQGALRRASLRAMDDEFARFQSAAWPVDWTENPRSRWTWIDTSVPYIEISRVQSGRRYRWIEEGREEGSVGGGHGGDHKPTMVSVLASATCRGREADGIAVKALGSGPGSRTEMNDRGNAEGCVVGRDEDFLDEAWDAGGMHVSKPMNGWIRCA